MSRQTGNRHNDCKDVADGHADAQTCGLFVATLRSLRPDHQQHEQATKRRSDGGGDVCHQNELRRRTAVAVTDHHGKGQADQAANADELALQADVLVKTGTQQHHAALGIGQQGREACAQQGQTHDVAGTAAHDGYQHLCQLGPGP